MKKCAYCAEEVREEAVVCPHCARPVLVEAAYLRQLGRIYTIGKTAESYGIWNMITGGGPVEKFELSDKGWEKAWGAISKLSRMPRLLQAAGLRAASFPSRSKLEELVH